MRADTPQEVAVLVAMVEQEKIRLASTGERGNVFKNVAQQMAYLYRRPFAWLKVKNQYYNQQPETKQAKNESRNRQKAENEEKEKGGRKRALKFSKEDIEEKERIAKAPKM